MSPNRKTKSNSIYSPKYVADLFNSMSATYGVTNFISSFGFTERWRQACIQKIEPGDNQRLHLQDWMSGMGELWPSIKRTGIEIESIQAVDISPKMNRVAQTNRDKLDQSVVILEQDILNNSIGDNTADVIVSSFGLKTFHRDQQKRLAEEVYRILKPGGCFSFVEISVPESSILKPVYMFYLRRIIPIIGYLFQGNSKDYKMLGIYTSGFGNCSHFCEMLRNSGLRSGYQNLFFGCASLTWGRKE